MPRTDCLTSAELTAFHLGDLPETVLDELAEHLETCPRCEAAARALDGLSDPQLDSFRRSAQAQAGAAEEPLPERVGDYESSTEWAAAAWASSIAPGTSRCAARSR